MNFRGDCVDNLLHTSQAIQESSAIMHVSFNVQNVASGGTVRPSWYMEFQSNFPVTMESGLLDQQLQSKIFSANIFVQEQDEACFPRCDMKHTCTSGTYKYQFRVYPKEYMDQGRLLRSVIGADVMDTSAIATREISGLATIGSITDGDRLYNNPVIALFDAVDQTNIGSRMQDKVVFKNGKFETVKCAEKRQRHIQRTHIPWQCGECPKKFPEKMLLDLHSKSHQKFVTYECRVCSMKFLLLEKFLAHIKIHENDWCGLCSKSFVDDHHFLVHLDVHTGRSSFHCHECGMDLKTPQAYRIHCVRHSPLPNRSPIACRRCGNIFQRLSDWSLHMRRQHFARPLQTPTIQPMVQSPDDHQPQQDETPKGVEQSRRHEEDYVTNISCSLCEASSIPLREWKTHSRQHFKELGFWCDLCKKGFLKRASLARHMVSHNRKKLQTTSDHREKANAY